MPCARLSWPFCQLLSARKYIVSYRIVASASFKLCIQFFVDSVRARIMEYALTSKRRRRTGCSEASAAKRESRRSCLCRPSRHTRECRSRSNQQELQFGRCVYRRCSILVRRSSPYVPPSCYRSRRTNRIRCLVRPLPGRTSVNTNTVNATRPLCCYAGRV